MDSWHFPTRQFQNLESLICITQVKKVTGICGKRREVYGNISTITFWKIMIISIWVEMTCICWSKICEDIWSNSRMIRSLVILVSGFPLTTWFLVDQGIHWTCRQLSRSLKKHSRIVKPPKLFPTKTEWFQNVSNQLASSGTILILEMSKLENSNTTIPIQLYCTHFEGTRDLINRKSLLNGNLYHTLPLNNLNKNSP